MFLVRGMMFSHEAVREWEAKLTPALAEDLRRRRRGKAGRSWYVDETYIKVGDRWCYLYRAIDRSGALIDVLLSERRDMKAARAFFRSAKAVTGVTPDRVTTDGHDSYPRAIRNELGRDVRHRTSRYLNNRMEQDHRGIKGRYRPMRGFKCPRSAARFCRGYDELRNFLRPRSRPYQHVPADHRRLQFLRRTTTGGSTSEAPCNFRMTGRTNKIKVTNAETGLPGRPKKNFVWHSPNTKGLPGLIATFQKTRCPPISSKAFLT